MTNQPRFMPYLERHRVYDLFYELSNLIGLNMPEDHVLFLRNTLVHMNETRHKPRLLLLAPPFIDIEKIVKILCEKTGQIALPRSLFIDDPEMINPEKLSECAQTYIAENDILKKGWILYDYPATDAEAKAMLLKGTCPTHTVLFIPLSKTKTSKQLWIENLDQWTTSEIKDTWNKYQRTIREFRYTFRETFMEVNILCKPLDQIMEECSKLLKEFPIRGPPVTPRILLIGTRGSRRGELAKQLYDRIGLIPVDMNEVIEEAKLSDTEIAEEIKFLDMRKVPIYASIILKLIQERLLKADCLANGWVLLRFPRDKADLVAIDSFDTPPNRIIFLVSNNNKAFKRLRDTRIHKYTGVIESHDEIKKRGIYMEENNYFIHPTDDEKRILLEHERFSSAYQDMVDYCGEDCAIVNASGKIEEVIERIETVIGKGTGQGGPRPGNLRNNIVCTEDTWGLARDDDTYQDQTFPVTSDPYLFHKLN